MTKATDSNVNQKALGALFKPYFGGLYLQLFPELKLRRSGDLSSDAGWDAVTYWVFEKA